MAATVAAIIYLHVVLAEADPKISACEITGRLVSSPAKLLQVITPTWGRTFRLSGNFP